jgi:hypothetical protein
MVQVVAVVVVVFSAVHLYGANPAALAVALLHLSPV